MSILVTGATGFLGQWLCKSLASKGYSDIRALVRPSSDSSYLKSLPIALHQGDVRDLSSFMQAAKGVDFIFHLAGLIAYSRKINPTMHSINVQGTAHAIEVAQKEKARLIYMSSVVAVGASITPHALNEQSPYEMSKFNIDYFETKKEAEIRVQKACKKGDLSAIILNPSTVYGAGDMRKPSRKIQIKVAQGKCPFYNQGGVSVVDVESVIQTTIQAMNKGRSGERYILSGDNITIKKLFEIIADAAKVKPPYIKLNNFTLSALSIISKGMNSLGGSFPLANNVHLIRFYHWFDHSKAREELGFSPQKAEQSIENSIKWWQKNSHSIK